MSFDVGIIKLVRRYDALMWKQHQLLTQIRESGHPKADALADALEEQCKIFARPTHVIHDHLEHPERFACGDFGICGIHHKKSNE